MQVSGRVPPIDDVRRLRLGAERRHLVGPALIFALQSVVAPSRVIGSLTVWRAAILLAACVVVEVAAYSGYMVVTKHQALPAYRAAAAREFPNDPTRAEIVARRRLEEFQRRFTRMRIESTVTSVATLTVVWFLIGLTLGADKHSWRGVFCAVCLAGVTATVMFLSQLALGLFLGQALQPATLAPFVRDSWPMGHFAESIRIATLWWCGAFAVGVAHVWRLRYSVALLIVSAFTFVWIAFGHSMHSLIGL